MYLLKLKYNKLNSLFLILLTFFIQQKTIAGDIQLIQYFELWNNGIIPSTDIAGITFHPTLGHLFISDSEINETSQWNNENIFEINLVGSTLYNSYVTAHQKQSRHEPTGICYNTIDGYFYITNDNSGTNGLYQYELSGSNFDTLNYWNLNSLFNIVDPEGITVNPNNGHLYIADGYSGAKKIWIIDVIGNSLNLVDGFIVYPTVGDPEGIAYDTETGHLFIVSSIDMAIFEYDINGNYIDQYDISGFTPTPQSPQGLTFGPRSTNSSLRSIYIADGGQDNYPDGIIYEAKIGEDKPLVSSFTPSSGVAGTQVTVSGSNFIGATEVSFNGVSASFTLHSDTQLVATVPAGATTGPISVTNSAGTGTSSADFVITITVRVELKIFLEGPYDTSTNEMSTDLRDNDYLPNQSPYSEDPRNVSSIPNNIVDWVLVELRETANGSAVASKSTFLRKDGKIVTDDGLNSYIKIQTSEGKYFIVIKHRNHLSIMSQDSIQLNSNSSSLYDFTIGSDKFYGTGGAKELKTNVWGMWAGDINQNGEITTSDYTLWYNSARTGDSGYKDNDCNLNAQVTTSDYTIWYNNARAGASSAIP